MKVSENETEYLLESYRQAQDDIRWAKGRGWTVMYAGALLNIGVFLGAEANRLDNLSPLWSATVVVGTTVASWYWLLDLNRFAASCRDHVRRLLTRFPPDLRHPGERGRDADNRRYLGAQIVVVVASGVTALFQLSASLEAPMAFPSWTELLQNGSFAATIAVAAFAGTQLFREWRRARKAEAEVQAKASTLGFRIRRQLGRWVGERGRHLSARSFRGIPAADLRRELEQIEPLVIELANLAGGGPSKVTHAINEVFVRWLRGARAVGDLIAARESHDADPNAEVNLATAKNEFGEVVRLLEGGVISRELQSKEAMVAQAAGAPVQRDEGLEDESGSGGVVPLVDPSA